VANCVEAFARCCSLEHGDTAPWLQGNRVAALAYSHALDLFRAPNVKFPKSEDAHC
jgi:hypothetical protein